ncbi:TPA: SIR2 family protein [Vibrio parahaemolyticus]|nr:SIR2 family protein [Vibrio parahaemolyticus]
MKTDSFDFLNNVVIPQCPYLTLSLEDCARNLCNESEVVFFTGAGFSKAWNVNYPLSYDLFGIDNIDELRSQYNFVKLADSLNIMVPDPSSDQYLQLCYEYFSSLKFHLDAYKRYPSLMPHNLDETIIEEFEDEIRGFVVQRFANKVGEDELNLNAKSNLNQELIEVFEKLSQKITHLTFISTNYDYIIEKIFNSIEGVNLNRGIVNRESFRAKSWEKSSISLFKINGGFEVYKDPKGFHLDYGSNASPNIILPSKDQNYDSKYYKNMFLKSAGRLREASKLVFVGYSLPVEDHTIRFLLKNFVDCESRPKEVYVINRDLKSALGVCEKVGQLFPTLLQNESIFAIDGSLNEMSNHLPQQ